MLQLGRMVPRKGVDNVIHGLARLRRNHGLVARLLVVSRSEAAELSRIEFTHWGENTIRMAAPGFDQVDTSRTVATGSR